MRRTSGHPVGRFALASLVLAALASALACGRGSGQKGGAPVQRPASLLLVTIDTWRWDYIGASGAGKARTPNLDRLAAEGFYQRSVQSPCPLTTPAHATILTGLLPLHHKVLNCGGYALGKDVPTLAEAFKAKGYATAAFVSSETLQPRYGLGRGFDLYDQGRLTTRGSADWMEPTRDGSLATAAFVQHLHGLPPSAPAFLWVHYYDLHTPYRPRPAYDPEYPGNPYAAQAAFVDEQVKALLDAVAADRGRNWRVAVVGDHGEGLGEHEEQYHGMGLYETTLAVPLVLWPRPDAALKGPAPWALQDLDPTLRAWFGLPANALSDGADRFAGVSPERPLPSLSALPSVIYSVNPILGIRKGRFMYIWHGVEELYDLEADAAELKDLAAGDAGSALLEELRRECSAAFPADQLQAALTPTLQNTSAELANLASLGYVGGPIAELGQLQKADMRAVIKDNDGFERAREEAYQSGSPKGLLALEPALLKKYPGATGLCKTFGLLYLKTGDTKKAYELLDKATRLNPRDVECLGNLGGLCLAMGRTERAKVLLEAGLALDESDPVIRKDLGILYSDYLDDPAKSLPHYRRYLELRPDDPDAEKLRAYVARMEPKYGKGG